MTVKMTRYPGPHDWKEAQRRALVTVGKKPINPPTDEWKAKSLRARHSYIRDLRFSFDLIGVPYWVAGHLVRHVHAQPYVRSQRNDRQAEYDREKAPQDAPVDMIWDMNAEELLTIMNKRLCFQAHPKTRAVVNAMRNLVIEKCPEFANELVPMCVRNGGFCYEMFPCEEMKGRRR